MDKYRYYFDWQESSIYEGIETRDKKIIAANGLNFGVGLTNKLKSNNANHNRINIVFPSSLTGITNQLALLV